MLIEKIYDEEIYSKNSLYDRKSILKSIDNAINRLNKSISAMSADDMEKGLNEYIHDMHGRILYERDGVNFVRIKNKTYCVLSIRPSAIDLNEVASQNSINEYILVTSTQMFLKEHLKEKLLHLLLRDYDILNYVPEEFQFIQSEINQEV